MPTPNAMVERVSQSRPNFSPLRVNQRWSVSSMVSSAREEKESWYRSADSSAVARNAAAEDAVSRFASSHRTEAEKPAAKKAGSRDSQPSVLPVAEKRKMANRRKNAACRKKAASAPRASLFVSV